MRIEESEIPDHIVDEMDVLSQNIKKLLPKGCCFALMLHDGKNVSFYHSYNCHSHLVHNMGMIAADMLSTPCPHEDDKHEQPVNHRINN